MLPNNACDWDYFTVTANGLKMFFFQLLTNDWFTKRLFDEYMLFTKYHIGPAIFFDKCHIYLFIYLWMLDHPQDCIDIFYISYFLDFNLKKKNYLLMFKKIIWWIYVISQISYRSCYIFWQMSYLFICGCLIIQRTVLIYFIFLSN